MDELIREILNTIKGKNDAGVGLTGVEPQSEQDERIWDYIKAESFVRHRGDGWWVTSKGIAWLAEG